MQISILRLLFLITAAGSEGILNAAEFASDFGNVHNRVWVGQDYWANPMEDWIVEDGKLECIRSGANRNVHLLTYGLSEKKPDAPFSISVRLGLQKDSPKNGSAGFAIGVLDQETRDPRASLLFGKGLVAGVKANGKLFIGKKLAEEALPSVEDLTLRLDARPPKRGDNYVLRIIALEAATDKELDRLSWQIAKNDSLEGNVAIGCNMEMEPSRKGGPKLARFWFSDWKLSGDKVKARPDLAFGPILYAMNTLSRGTLNLTAQMPPLGEKESKHLRLDAKDAKGNWQKTAHAITDPLSRTATFRVKQWDDTRDVSYRIAFNDRKRDGSAKEKYFDGIIRKDPKEKKEIVVAGFTGNKDTAFPNAKLVKNVGIVNPDVLFFSGDQIYEDVGGYGIHRNPVDLAVLNYLRKIYLWGWAFRDLMRDRFTIALTDDNDVYQGNIWGQSGRDSGGMKGNSGGGYAMHPDFVNAVQRTQTAHHPAPFDPTPVEQGIGVYYGDMVYGRIGFAVLEDRKFKSGPEGKVNSWKGRPDHIRDPKFDTKSIDKEGLVLLGKRQLKFLRHFAEDWKGTDLKMALSQTIFCNLANYHGGGQQYIVADLDSNGWPQTGRNRALEELRRGFVFHYAGDQHLASIVHHGIDQWGDAGYSFCVPSIAAGYPRSWRPDKEGRPVRNRPAAGLPNTGEYKDGLQNILTVHAIGNPTPTKSKSRLNTLHGKASGYGVVRMNKAKGTITMECHRLLIDASDLKPNDQFPGWPKTINYRANYERAPAAYLPEIRMQGLAHPVIQVKNAKTNELVYALRIREDFYRPPVFDKTATYKVRVGEPDNDVWKILENLKPDAAGKKTIVSLEF
jgi:alkaline phosphatase D